MFIAVSTELMTKLRRSETPQGQNRFRSTELSESSSSADYKHFVPTGLNGSHSDYQSSDSHHRLYHPDHRRLDRPGP